MKFLVVDTGYFFDVALSLARSGHEVYYYVEWVEGMPRLEKYVTGDGFDELVKVLDWAVLVNDVDAVVFTDVGFGSIADYLRSKGVAVFGASYLGQQLELDREFMHSVMTARGIKRPETKIVHGVEELKEAVKEFGEAFIKVSVFRGNAETFHVSSVDEVDALVDNASFGPYIDDMEFVVERPVDGVEIGGDMLFNGSKFVKPYLFGLEIKDKANYSVWVEESPLDDFMSRIAGFLADSGYRGTISVEGMLNEGGFYVLDITARYPFPAQGILTRAVSDYGEIVYDVAMGNDVFVEPKKKFGAEIVVWTSEKDKWVPVDVEEAFSDMLSWRFVVKKGGKYWHVPASEVVCGCVGLGSRLSRAINVSLGVSGAVNVSGKIDGAESVGTFMERRRKLADVWGEDIYR